VIYTATYSSTINQYIITFVDEDLITVLKSGVKYDYGTPVESIQLPPEPTKEASPQYNYSFA
jgi:hypothetical protein